MPQPLPGCDFGKVSTILRTSSGADGAPPYDTFSSEERSYFARAGCSINCHAIVGTPPAPFTFSRSMSCMAPSASHLRMSTILPPAMSVGLSTAKQPVAWKNGTERSVQRCGSFSGSATGTGSPRRRKFRAAALPDAKMLEFMLRCVPSAPLGLPVVPDV